MLSANENLSYVWLEKEKDGAGREVDFQVRVQEKV